MSDDLIDTPETDESKTPTQKLPERDANVMDKYAQLTEANFEADIAFKKAQTEEAKAKADFYKGLIKLLPMAENYFKVKTPEVIEAFKSELKAQLEFTVASVLYQAGMVDRELVDAMARKTHTPPPTEVEHSAADDALSGFDPSKFKAPKPIM